MCIHDFNPSAVEFLQHQHAERAAREKHLTDLKEEISQLNNAIALSQQQLPASGAPITRQVGHCTFVCIHWLLIKGVTHFCFFIEQYFH